MKIEKLLEYLKESNMSEKEKVTMIISKDISYKQQPEEWESRFKKKFTYYGRNQIDQLDLLWDGTIPTPDMMVDFIKTEIRKAEERVGREQYNQALFDVYKSLEALKK